MGTFAEVLPGAWTNMLLERVVRDAAAPTFRNGRKFGSEEGAGRLWNWFSAATERMKTDRPRMLEYIAGFEYVSVITNAYLEAGKHLDQYPEDEGTAMLAAAIASGGFPSEVNTALTAARMLAADYPDLPQMGRFVNHLFIHLHRGVCVYTASTARYLVSADKLPQLRIAARGIAEGWVGQARLALPRYPNEIAARLLLEQAVVAKGLREKLVAIGVHG